MRRDARSQHGAGAGVVWNFAHKWLYGALALLVSKSYFESNVLEIILDRKHVHLCAIPGIHHMTAQKWEVCHFRTALVPTRRHLFPGIWQAPRLFLGICCPCRFHPLPSLCHQISQRNSFRRKLQRFR